MFEDGCAASRYKFVTEPEICHGAEICWRADERIRVPEQNKLSRNRKPRKNRDKFINTTVRVRLSNQFKCQDNYTFSAESKKSGYIENFAAR